MNLEEIRRVIDRFAEDVNPGLLSCDLYDRDGFSIYGINSNPNHCSVFSHITNMIKRSLEGTGFPRMEYYTIFAEENRMVLVVDLGGGYQFGAMIDRGKTTPGIVFSVALPRLIEDLKKLLPSGNG